MAGGNIRFRQNSKWQSGIYEVIATYDNAQIGNVSFKVQSASEQGFGGILPQSDSQEQMMVIALVVGIIAVSVGAGFYSMRKK